MSSTSMEQSIHHLKQELILAGILCFIVEVRLEKLYCILAHRLKISFGSCVLKRYASLQSLLGVGFCDP